MTQPPSPEAARLAEDLRTAYHSKTRIGHPMWQNLSEDSKGPWIAAALAALSQPRPATDEASERERFEAWYCVEAFDYVRDPIGSHRCGLQWAAWKAAKADMSTPAPQIDASAGCVEAARAVIDARDAFGWSADADAAIERLRGVLAPDAAPGDVR